MQPPAPKRPAFDPAGSQPIQSWHNPPRSRLRSNYVARALKLIGALDIALLDLLLAFRQGGVRPFRHPKMGLAIYALLALCHAALYLF